MNIKQVLQIIKNNILEEDENKEEINLQRLRNLLPAIEFLHETKSLDESQQKQIKKIYEIAVILITNNRHSGFGWDDAYYYISEEEGILYLNNLLMKIIRWLEIKDKKVNEKKAEKTAMKKIIDIKNSPVEIHSCNFTGMEFILKNPIHGGDTWGKPKGLTFREAAKQYWLGVVPQTKPLFKKHEVQFNLNIALFIQDILLKENVVANSSTKIVSDWELDYVKKHPIIENKPLKQQDFKTLKILRQAKDVVLEKGDLSKKESSLPAGYSIADRQHHYETAFAGVIFYYGADWEYKIDKQYRTDFTEKNLIENLKGIVLYKQDKHNIEIAKQIMMRCFGTRYDLYVPIYNLDCEVVWPK